MRMRKDDERNQEKEEEGRTYGQVFMSARGRLCEGGLGREYSLPKKGNEQRESVLGTNKVLHACALCVRESRNKLSEKGRRGNETRKGVHFSSWILTGWADLSTIAPL